LSYRKDSNVGTDLSLVCCGEEDRAGPMLLRIYNHFITYSSFPFLYSSVVYIIYILERVVERSDKEIVYVSFFSFPSLMSLPLIYLQLFPYLRKKIISINRLRRRSNISDPESNKNYKIKLRDSNNIGI
jgi:hypothetical protein